MSRQAERANLWRIFAGPLLILAASIVGLVAALVANGLGDWISWAALSVPIAAVVWGRLRRSR
ncbi:hypothetical protein [Phenylobacterium sp.]|uniref:hypothetical protein n=1 Tax=Phenylobacterium sp. TaxID=1871053 RepID=UPI00272FE5D5|nr:hypothetical protein [Phenylobacterium sp.]MDP1619296.1 hypothetical protein [Phenylobacterium sp.]MDP1987749.1 hypothetical protein [Phenylobacterium sp.]